MAKLSLSLFAADILQMNEELQTDKTFRNYIISCGYYGWTFCTIIWIESSLAETDKKSLFH